MTKKIRFMCTAFRDGFQSIYGARVLTKDFLPALEAARDAGITWFESGGGARFQSLYFYCNEDAFDMMDAFRETVGPDANLQTLARGVNVVGLESQSSDIVRMHAELFKKHGVTTVRNFDALNDVDNLIFSGKCIVEAGLKHQVCVTIMELPPGCEGAHDADFYEQTLRKILDADIPYDAVCFKDASGTAVPSKVHETIRRARKMLGPKKFIHFHTHETAGISVNAYMAALDAGADAIDLSLSPVSGGTCQPDLLVMWHALRGTNYDLDIDIDKVRKAEEVFQASMRDYFMPPEATMVEPMIPWSPMPGGALTANTQMLRDNKIIDKYPAIIRAMRDVVERGGFGTSVTPVSQFYFQQAFNNVMIGPWKKIADTYGRMVLGYFGKTPVPPDPEVVELAKSQLKMEPTTESPLVRNDADPEKGIDAARKQLQAQGIEETDENIFIIATCGDKGIKFLKGDAEIGVRKIKAKPEVSAAQQSPKSQGPSAYTVTVNGKDFWMVFEDGNVTVNGKVYQVHAREEEDPSADGSAKTDETAGTPVVAQMPGVVLSVARREGDRVTAGDVLLVMEAMKMEVQINAPVTGTLRNILVVAEEHIETGQLLATIV